MQSAFFQGALENAGKPAEGLAANKQQAAVAPEVAGTLHKLKPEFEESYAKAISSNPAAKCTDVLRFSEELPELRDNLTRAMRSNGYVDGQGATGLEKALPSYAQGMRRTMLREIESAIRLVIASDVTG